MIELVYICRKCGKANSISSFQHDRYKLSEKLGTEFKAACKYCGAPGEIHFNNVYARIIPAYGMIIFGLLFLLACYSCVFLWKEYWRDSVLIQNKSIQVAFIGFCIPISVMVVLSIPLKEKIRAFNKYRL
jgi:DNA-directed RNA polymerase subunit RPC12/RpoP